MFLHSPVSLKSPKYQNGSRVVQLAALQHDILHIQLHTLTVCLFTTFEKQGGKKMNFAAGQNNTSSDCTASVAPQWGAVKRAALRLGFSIASLLHCTRLRVSAHMMLTCIGRHSFWSYAVWVLLRVRLSQRPVYYCPPLQLDKPLTRPAA